MQSSRADSCPSPTNLIYSVSKTHKQHAHAWAACFLALVYSAPAPYHSWKVAGSTAHALTLSWLLLKFDTLAGKQVSPDSSHCSCKCSQTDASTVQTVGWSQRKYIYNIVNFFFALSYMFSEITMKSEGNLMIVHRPIRSTQGCSGCPLLLKPGQACSAVSIRARSTCRLGGSHCRKSWCQQFVPLFLLEKCASEQSILWTTPHSGGSNHWVALGALCWRLALSQVFAVIGRWETPNTGQSGNGNNENIPQEGIYLCTDDVSAKTYLNWAPRFQKVIQHSQDNLCHCCNVAQVSHTPTSLSAHHTYPLPFTLCFNAHVSGNDPLVSHSNAFLHTSDFCSLWCLSGITMICSVMPAIVSICFCQWKDAETKRVLW